MITVFKRPDGSAINWDSLKGTNLHPFTLIPDRTQTIGDGELAAERRTDYGVTCRIERNR